jgi:hypothetical protein
MSVKRNITYLTDEKGKKKNVLLRLSGFEKMQEVEDLEHTLALERSRKDATGFKRWKEFDKALQKGQLALSKSSDMTSSHPYFWAPFILVGDWK